MHQVFVCHASADQAIATALCERLEADGLRCWIAPRDLRGGNEWSGALVHAIKDSQVLLLILSTAANNSPHVIREVTQAVDGRVGILPVRVEDVRPSESLSYHLGAVHWIDAFKPSLERHLASVSKEVFQFVHGSQSPPSTSPEVREGNAGHGASMPSRRGRTVAVVVGVACLGGLGALALDRAIGVPTKNSAEVASRPASASPPPVAPRRGAPAVNVGTVPPGRRRASPADTNPVSAPEPSIPAADPTAMESSSTLSGTWILRREGQPNSRAVGQVTLNLQGTRLTAFGPDWSGTGVFAGSQGYYDWRFTDGKVGRTTLFLDGDGVLHSKIRGSNIDWDARATRR